jgi:integrase
MPIVKYKSVSVTVYPWRHSSGREYYRFKVKGKPIQRSTLEAAKKEALKHCQTVYRGSLDLASITPEQSRAARRMIEADPSCALIEEFILWHSKRAAKKNCQVAVKEFLAAKKAAAGRSAHNVEILTRHLSVLPDMDLADITPADLPPLTGAARTRTNRRAVWITFFKWCAKMEYLPHGERSAPEKIERPIVVRSVPETYSRAELDILIANSSKNYLPGLLLSAWAGLRTEEMFPDSKSGKDALRWSDIKWARDLIEVRPEVAKTGVRRWVPLLPALRAALDPMRPEDDSARMGPNLPPHTPAKGGVMAETTRLGKFIGGWRRNALRHSFISFYAATEGLAKAAMAAGNSEREAAKSYNDAKGADEADEWFA